MSRPKKPIGTHLAITAIRMPPQVKVKLEKLSKETGLAQQEHIRRALDAYFFDLISKGQFEPPEARATSAPRTPRPQSPVRQGIKEILQPKRRIFRRPGASA